MFLEQEPSWPSVSFYKSKVLVVTQFYLTWNVGQRFDRHGFHRGEPLTLFPCVHSNMSSCLCVCFNRKSLTTPVLDNTLSLSPWELHL